MRNSRATTTRVDVLSEAEIQSTQSRDVLQICRGPPHPHAGMVGCFCEVIQIKGAVQTDKSKPRSKKHLLNVQRAGRYYAAKYCNNHQSKLVHAGRPRLPSAPLLCPAPINQKTQLVGNNFKYERGIKIVFSTICIIKYYECKLDITSTLMFCLSLKLSAYSY